MNIVRECIACLLLQMHPCNWQIQYMLTFVYTSSPSSSINPGLLTVQNSSVLYGIHCPDSEHRPIRTVHWHPPMFL